MANPSNLLKRNYAYYWRRSLLVADAPITLVLSLHTKAPTVARRRCALMTVKSEDVRMSLYARLRIEGIPPDRRLAIFRAEMTEYRNALDHEVLRWESASESVDACSTQSGLRIFQSLWGHIAEHGVPAGAIDGRYLRDHLADLEPIERHGLASVMAGLPDFRGALVGEAIERLADQGVTLTPTNSALAIRLVAAARAQAAHELLVGIPADAGLSATKEQLESPATPAPLPKPMSAPLAAHPAPAIDVPTDWVAKSAHDIAELIIATNPQLLAHRAAGKRAVNQVGEQTKRQLRWAATLLDKSMSGRPFWTRTRADIVELDKWFERLPTMTGKSPRHHEASCTLEMIEAEALARIDDGELRVDDLGFTTPNTNKHFRFLSQIDKFAVKNIPGLTLVGFNEFCTPDLKDEREARQRISVDQATAIFGLPPWTGCASLDDRLAAGSLVYHDGLYWVLLLVWHTGARREEICKLMVIDVDCLDGVWFLQIRFSETGRVKNRKSIRVIPIAEELIRLGFVEIVLAMKAQNETLLFPDLQPSGSTKRKFGDVFYKLWWIYIAPMIEPRLARGQAMQACRHAVEDELKRNEIFIETRNDLMGHTGSGGEGETRYSKATSLAKLKTVVDLIPIVTRHLPTVVPGGIRLLPPKHRVARPSRTKGV